jgi:Ca-activated chloride channel family protein
LAAVSALPAVAADRTIIVFDASGSMWAQIDGKSRIEIARETISSVLGSLPADAELGLMAYGHREKGSCSDIELLVPPAAGTGPAIIAATAKINPKGKTPLSEAVKRAAEELK